MSDMLSRFLESKKPRPAEARKIPALATDFFDRTHEFQDGFTTFEKPGQATEYTAKAMEYFDTEHKNMPVADFTPVEPGVPLHRWTPNNPYSVPDALGLTGNS